MGPLSSMPRVVVVSNAAPPGFIDECVEWTTAMVAWNVWIDDPEHVARGQEAKRQVMQRIAPFVEEQVRNPGTNIIGEFVRAMKEADRQEREAKAEQKKLAKVKKKAN